MKKDLVKLAIVGLLAGFCLSAQGAPSDSNEIAMSKCSKDNTQKSQNRNNDQDNDGSDANGCGGPNGCGDSPEQDTGDQQSDKVQMMQSKRKSAAQKTVEGE